jgi:hypothetical protein
MVTRLRGVATPFGPLHLEVRVSPAGRKAHLRVQPLGRGCERVVVHLAGWATTTSGAARTFPPGSPMDVDIPLRDKP